MLPSNQLYCLPYSFERILQSNLTACPDPGFLKQVPLGQPPFLNRLRHWYPSFVRRLLRYYEAVRLPTSVYPWRSPSGFSEHTLVTLIKVRYGISRLPRKVFPFMHKVSDRAESEYISR